ncbi:MULTISPECIES: BACON domain-containing protein, partial [unclassified Parabacteroides]|uniref:BACON domain-containing protein n=1 Tax=unclassified Parabacteroides TaxID=2649774 RepID=UPI002475D4C4
LSIQKTADKQRLVLVANLPESVTLSPTATTTVADLFNDISFDASLWQTASTGSYPRFPMWGQMKQGYDFSATSAPTEINVNMFRTMAKVDVGVDMGDASSTLAAAFKIKEVSVYAKPASYLTPHGNYMTGTGIDQDVFTEPRPVSGAIASHTYAVASPYKEILRTIYIPESEASTSSVPQTYLIIKGEWTSGEWNGKTGYYRVDFADGSSFIPIVRNHAYRINITKVNTAGYASETEAESAAPDITGKDLVVEGMNDNINDIVYNETDWLGVNVSSVLFDWDKMLVGNAMASTADKNKFALQLYTTYGSWTATLEGSPSWLKITPASGTQTPDVLSGFEIEVLSENLTGTERQATITLRSGMLSMPITVRQSGGANSHLIRFATGASAEIRIPVSFALKALGDNPASPTTDLSKATARVLWYETKESTPVTFTAELSLDKKYITVTAASNGTQFNGNAVIALMDGSGIGWVGSDNPANVLWSWHVWSMKGSGTTDPDVDINFHNPNKDRLMRTVLGKYGTAQKGMFYQWGRKDPFPQYTTGVAPRSIVIDAAGSNNTETYVRQNPTVFYTGSHWLTSAVPARWTAGSKAEYNDPCPTGWRVPAGTDNYEWTLPVAISHFQNGILDGSTDGAWASSGHYLWITSGTNYPYWTATGNTVTAAMSTNTTTGANIRCVKDIKLVK